MEQNNIPADVQEQIEDEAEIFKKLPHYKDGSPLSCSPQIYLKRGYIVGATAEAKRAQENKRLLDEAQTLLSKEREKGWKLFNALEWIKTYGPVDDLTIKFIDKALQQWKDRKEDLAKRQCPDCGLWFKSEGRCPECNPMG